MYLADQRLVVVYHRDPVAEISAPVRGVGRLSRAAQSGEEVALSVKLKARGVEEAAVVAAEHGAADFGQHERVLGEIGQTGCF